MESLHAGAIEELHKSSKSLYADSSRHKRTAMGEIVFIQNLETMENTDSFINSIL